MTSASDAEWEELRKEMLQFFKEFDVNNTNQLGLEEVAAILKSVGLRCTIEEVREMISQVATPNATSIDFEQLMNILKIHTHQEDEDETIRQAFEAIDIDGDGLISAEDIQCFMQSIGEDFDRKYAERMLKAATGSKETPVDLERYRLVLKSRWGKAEQPK
ncbi:calmodulin-like protein 4 [Histomonas meleagridis]|uniref:calmodulin-like protein 4 n=1 Tax=Histomonas meleagridis TaxID=135588 RepID=UPI00355985DB|nr:calmodulin-like protein 4 [Histomonas meleagridis]KAH0800800.1 calmodulin-like protein 4 [Histomonas meleagridis]